MKRIFPILFCLIFGVQAFAQKKAYLPKSSTFEPNYFPATPDYSNKNTWAALPDRKDMADSVPSKPGAKDGQMTAQADVFWIHPTTYVEKPKGRSSWNADINDKELNTETDQTTILYQSSIFNESCKVYAPRYRQAHIYAFFSDKEREADAAFDTAYSDVKAAFEYYLKNYNNGRPFIIASHSQGTVHAARLLREKFVNKPLLRQLVAAYVVGMPVTADTLRGLPPCQAEEDINCFVTWCTYANGYYPTTYEDGAKKAHCTNPLTWKSEEENYAEASANMGGVLKNFSKVVPNMCDARVHKGVLWINPPNVPGAKLAKIDNFHIGDFNLFYFNIRENVKKRVNSFLAKKH